jgi:hypothetical protein
VRRNRSKDKGHKSKLSSLVLSGSPRPWCVGEVPAGRPEGASRLARPY